MDRMAGPIVTRRLLEAKANPAQSMHFPEPEELGMTSNNSGEAVWPAAGLRMLPLHRSALRNDVDTLQLLLEADPEASTQSEAHQARCALHFAAAAGLAANAEALLVVRPEMAFCEDKLLRRPLHYAAASLSVETVKVLLGRMRRRPSPH